MGQVVPFIARVRDSGDWSATERARLEALADQLAAQGVDVEVIFGATDEGDPWCVVTDGNGDVLIHVARIDGRFVVHSAVDDTVDENFDLHAALRERLTATEDAVAPKSATILPFTTRQGQSFLALVVAAAFFYETAGVFDEAQAAEPPHAPPAALEEPPPVAHDAPGQEREIVAQGVVTTADPGSTSVIGPVAGAEAASEMSAKAGAVEERALPPTVETAPAQSAAEAPAAVPPAPEAAVIQGTAGDDHLVGGAAAERIEGGAGNDTLEGGGGRDTLLGGAGDDRLVFTDGATVEGGSGADTFVVTAATHGGGANTLLGIILDFAGDEGDRLFAGGRAIHLPPRASDKTAVTTTDTDPAPPRPAPPTGTDGDFDVTTTTQPSGEPPTLVGPPTLTPTSPFVRVDIDFDGDGVIDGYILVGRRGEPPPGPPPGHDDPPITVTGHSLPPPDPFG